METIHISTLSNTLTDGHPEMLDSINNDYGVSIKKHTYTDWSSNQMYLVTVDLNSDDILNIEKVSQIV
tara:strand:+ start:459 stop:662 length:204 start_codon:yes stop_codon:yes gene_type:complete